MAQNTTDLDSKCSKARPWVRRFVEQYQDGAPWGYAIFEDPTIDEEQYEEFWCAVDTKLERARGAVFGRDISEFPPFEWERLDWPSGDDQEEDAPELTKLDISGATEVQGQPQVTTGHEAAGSEDQDDEVGEGNEGDANNGVVEDDEDDADIETVRELDKLRAHFKWVRDRAKKRRKAYESADKDRSGIPRGLLGNVFLVIDQDVVDSVVNKSPVADNAWIWAIDPDYEGDVALMTKNGLKDDYYGYMRVRLQQLVNNFWDARHYHEDELPFPKLWQAAQQSPNYAFVSVDPAEARLWFAGTSVGSALRKKQV